MSKTNAMEVNVLNHNFRTTKFTGPTNVFIALFTAMADGEAGSGTEVSGGSYARVQVAAVDAQWTDPTGTGSINNVNDVLFPAPTGNWGDITHFAVMSASTGGTMYYQNTITAGPKTVNSGDQAPVFPAGTLVVTES